MYGFVHFLRHIGFSKLSFNLKMTKKCFEKGIEKIELVF
jgi:hypothetical protein